MSNTPLYTWIAFHLLISFIESQRVTLFSWSFATGSRDGWTVTGSHSDYVDTDYCPGDRSCHEMSAGDTFYIYVDTIGYSDIQIGYDIRTLGVDTDETCSFQYYTVDSDWIEYAQHIQNNEPKTVLHTSLPNSLDNADFGIDFWANMDAGEYCWLNNVFITGIRIPESTAEPTNTPTPKSTTKPTHEPTPRPTNPDTATCGDNVIGSYNGSPVTFIVNIPFEGDLEFNAAPSSFVVTDIEAFTKLNVPLATDTDNDEKITLSNIPAGDYKFIINGEGTDIGTFEARIRCITASPSSAPTQAPTVSRTQPQYVACDEDKVGIYYVNSKLTFYTIMPYIGELTFDASGSDFTVTAIESYTQLGSFLGSDSDHDQVITIYVPSGDYTFIMTGNVQNSGVYHVKVRCVPAEPTAAPSSPQPTHKPAAPSSHPTKRPTKGPTPLMIAYIPTKTDIMDTITNTAKGNTLIAFWEDPQTMITAIILFGVCIICCTCCGVALLCYICARKREHKESINEMVNLQIKSADPQPSTVIKDERHLVKSWLRYTVELPQYCDLFIWNGYDSMRVIEAISSIEELNAIGVKAEGHQMFILMEIKKLQAKSCKLPSNVVMGTHESAAVIPPASQVNIYCGNDWVQNMSVEKRDHELQSDEEDDPPIGGIKAQADEVQHHKKGPSQWLTVEGNLGIE